MTMFVLVYTIYLMHHPVYIYIQFIVYQCLSKKKFSKKIIFEPNQEYEATRVACNSRLVTASRHSRLMVLFGLACKAKRLR